MKKFKNWIIVFSTVFALASCKKDTGETDSGPSYQDADKTSEINVPANFSWRTSENISVSIQPENNGMLLIIDNRGTVYARAYLKPNESYTTSVAVPTYAEKLFLYFHGTEEEISLNSANHISQLK